MFKVKKFGLTIGWHQLVIALRLMKLSVGIYLFNFHSNPNDPSPEKHDCSNCFLTHIRPHSASLWRGTNDWEKTLGQAQGTLEGSYLPACLGAFEASLLGDGGSCRGKRTTRLARIPYGHKILQSNRQLIKDQISHIVFICPPSYLLTAHPGHPVVITGCALPDLI